MSTTTIALGESASVEPIGGANARPVTSSMAAFLTLTRRRIALSAHTPREIFVPILTPILFACVIAPALAKSMPSTGVDYLSFVAVGTIGLLIPLSCVLGGIGMIVDRDSGAQRDLLAAPVPRSTLVLGNLAVAVAVALFQVAVLLGAAVLRGATFHVNVGGLAWAATAALGIAVAMHGFAEVLAAKIERQEEYVGAAPPVALLPWFFAGSFFRISSMPIGLTWVARALPLTHALALLRYGLIDRHGSGLYDIWGMHSTATMAALSAAVVVAFAVVMLTVATRTFARSAVH